MSDETQPPPRRAKPLHLATQDGEALPGQELPGGGGPPGGGGSGALPPGAEHLPPVYASEDAMTEILVVRQLKGDWRYVFKSDSQGTWYRFDGACWRPDDGRLIRDMAREVGRATAVIEPIKKADHLSVSYQRKISGQASARGVETMARSDRRISTPLAAFDAEPMAINTPGGIIDLANGQLGPPDRERLCRFIAGAAPYGDCPHWHQFLREVTNGDLEYEDYLRRLVGYSLVGHKKEEIFVFLYGPSNTGKSKFVECLRRLHGSYGTSAPMDSFIASPMPKHSTDLAGFVGKRLVTAAETEEGRRWDQQRLTTLTGGDRISARFMRGDFFEYVPAMLLVFHGNWRPRLGHVSDAMRRRMHLLPFLHKPLVIDKDLLDKFQAELEGIMAWAILGCLEWQQRGLDPPRVVVEATGAYFELEDTIGQWIEECCDVDPVNPGDLYAGSRELYVNFVAWMKPKGGYVVPESVFVGRLELLKGIHRSPKLPNGKRGFYGIALKNRQDGFKFGG